MDKFEKYIGKIIEIIYLDRHHKITKREVVVRSVTDDTVYATCLTAKAWRPFKIKGILSWQPVNNKLRKVAW